VNFTVPCAHCGAQHAAYWIVSADNKKKLFYTCNKVKTLLAPKSGNPRLALLTRQIQVEDQFLVLAARKLKDKIPVVWNKRKAKKEFEKSQMGLL